MSIGFELAEKKLNRQIDKQTKNFVFIYVEIVIGLFYGTQFVKYRHKELSQPRKSINIVLNSS